MPPRKHPRQKRLDPTDYAKHIDPETPLPVRDGDLLQRPAQDDAGIVHHQTSWSQLCLRSVRQSRDIIVTGDVAVHRQDAPTKCLDLIADLRKPAVVDVRQDNIRAPTRQRQRGAAANPTGAPGDYGDLAGDLHATAGTTASATSSSAATSLVS